MLGEYKAELVQLGKRIDEMGVSLEAEAKLKEIAELEARMAEAASGMTSRRPRPSLPA